MDEFVFSYLTDFDYFPLIKKIQKLQNMITDLFTTTFSPYLLRFFTVNYALRLNLTILRLNKHRFFQNLFVQKGTYRDWSLRET